MLSRIWPPRFPIAKFGVAKFLGCCLSTQNQGVLYHVFELNHSRNR